MMMISRWVQVSGLVWVSRRVFHHFFKHDLLLRYGPLVVVVLAVAVAV